ncbi:STAS domain-containing protein [Actinoplanes sp. NPDC049265]|uniref:STAS domain-containing protein n=1 Tax=Actinoplanes sp. NPDC049265 TaxID=3363902 RepID=UPI003720E2AD
MTYSVRHHIDPRAVVITPMGDLDADAAAVLRHELMTAAEHGGHVIVDLHGVHLIDSPALGLLVRAHQRTREQHGTFALVAPSRFVRTVLHTMRLDTAFTTYDDLDTALGARVEVTAQRWSL